MLWDPLCHHISTTPSPLSQLFRDSRMYRSGHPFFLYKEDLFIGQYHTYPYPHSINLASSASASFHYYHHHLSSSPQHVIIFLKFEACISCPTFTYCSSFSLFSRMLSLAYYCYPSMCLAGSFTIYRQRLW